MMFRSLVQCFHYFIFIADFDWGVSLALSPSLSGAIWYAFIRSMVWIHQCDFMAIKTLTLIKAAMIGCLVTVQAQAQAHSLNIFFFIGDWCVFFLLFCFFLCRFSSIHSMWFSSACMWHADRIDSINNFIFSTQKNVLTQNMFGMMWISINNGNFRQIKVLLINLTKLTHYGFGCVFV